MGDLSRRRAILRRPAGRREPFSPRVGREGGRVRSRSVAHTTPRACGVAAGKYPRAECTSGWRFLPTNRGRRRRRDDISVDVTASALERRIAVSGRLQQVRGSVFTHCVARPHVVVAAAPFPARWSSPPPPKCRHHNQRRTAPAVASSLPPSLFRPYWFCSAARGERNGPCAPRWTGTDAAFERKMDCTKDAAPARSRRLCD